MLRSFSWPQAGLTRKLGEAKQLAASVMAEAQAMAEADQTAAAEQAKKFEEERRRAEAALQAAQRNAQSAQDGAQQATEEAKAILRNLTAAEAAKQQAQAEAAQARKAAQDAERQQADKVRRLQAQFKQAQEAADAAAAEAKKRGGGGLLTLPDTWQGGTRRPAVSNDGGAHGGKYYAQRVDVPYGTPEYKELERAFKLSQPKYQGWDCRVTKIERIQNVALYQSYSIWLTQLRNRERERKEMKLFDFVPDDKCETSWMWHGTAPEVLPKVVAQGLNRSFAGKNATAYGKGNYFATDSSYSVCYSNGGPLLACRVATGACVMGISNQRQPGEDPRTGALTYRDKNACLLYDTSIGLDGSGQQKNRVTYNDAQAYPAYVVHWAT